jgi:hypothetical protein
VFNSVLIIKPNDVEKEGILEVYSENNTNRIILKLLQNYPPRVIGKSKAVLYENKFSFQSVKKQCLKNKIITYQCLITKAEEL